MNEFKNSLSAGVLNFCMFSKEGRKVVSLWDGVTGTVLGLMEISLGSKVKWVSE